MRNDEDEEEKMKMKDEKRNDEEIDNEREVVWRSVGTRDVRRADGPKEPEDRLEKERSAIKLPSV